MPNDRVPGNEQKILYKKKEGAASPMNRIRFLVNYASNEVGLLASGEFGPVNRDQSRALSGVIKSLADIATIIIERDKRLEKDKKSY